MRKPADKPVLSAFAAEVKARRALIGISQEELAHRAGLHRSSVARLEVAETQPSLVALFRLAAALEADEGEFVAGIARRYRKEAARGAKKRSTAK